MASQAILRLLEQYPQLGPFIEEGRFLIGYTNGSANGKQVPVFLLRSPWTQFCIQAMACDSLISGAVLVVTDDSQWSHESNWKAYNFTMDSPSPKSSRRNFRQRRSFSAKSVPPLAAMAAEIATEETKKSPVLC
ncbi:MAG: hypothetical protein ACTMUB_01545 [cyanobacterium endosymbiont of Rhopalodia musculus]|uniref:hypothetical protein n=1 Tax=cyanobacterium endosymbiont of Epithemia clementina EcSB TaxID=3034674 RepID=UPI002480437D|nr:hypothetical protein [cyanobacterium endosymbiont of Epithemia clementina EcSB]WGT66940.1 hypothetical protein P3F56_06750 [cyanobacterium endosymbiont of Epithemia clementina EcSB]